MLQEIADHGQYFQKDIPLISKTNFTLTSIIRSIKYVLYTCKFLLQLLGEPHEITSDSFTELSKQRNQVFCDMINRPWSKTSLTKHKGIYKQFMDEILKALRTNLNHIKVP